MSEAEETSLQIKIYSFLENAYNQIAVTELSSRKKDLKKWK